MVSGTRYAKIRPKPGPNQDKQKQTLQAPRNTILHLMIDTMNKQKQYYQKRKQREQLRREYKYVLERVDKLIDSLNSE